MRRNFWWGFLWGGSVFGFFGFWWFSSVAWSNTFRLLFAGGIGFLQTKGRRSGGISNTKHALERLVMGKRISASRYVTLLFLRVSRREMVWI